MAKHMPYDDEYDGPRWRYGLTLRPISQYLGARDLETDEPIPWITHSSGGSEDPRFKRFGTFDCAAELSETTVRQFSLVLVKTIEAGGSLSDA